MKNLFAFFFCCCFFLPNALAVGHYSNGDTLYVWAYRGSTLRSVPSIKGAKKLTIPYGDQVLVLDSIRVQAFSVEDLPGITLHGHWSKVRYKAEEGWIFDGYLSKYIPMERADRARLKSYKSWQEEFLPYGEKAFGPVKKRRLKLDSDQPTQDSLYYHDVYTYRNGVVFEDFRWAEGDGGGQDQTYTFPNFSFEECYLFFVYNRGFALEDPRYNTHLPEEYPWPKLTERDEKHWVVDMENYEYRFEKQGNLLHISLSSPF